MTQKKIEKNYTIFYLKRLSSLRNTSFLIEEDLKGWIEKKDNKLLSNMYLTNQAIVFEFDKYEVTAGAAGMPKITLPFEQVSEIVSAEWLDRLN
ncbi:DUF3298 domain-containing protein, partial [Butyricicoccus sp. 1XD8-22]